LLFSQRDCRSLLGHRICAIANLARFTALIAWTMVEQRGAVGNRCLRRSTLVAMARHTGLGCPRAATAAELYGLFVIYRVLPAHFPI
jgi:hypothetical protein